MDIEIRNVQNGIKIRILPLQKYSHYKYFNGSNFILWHKYYRVLVLSYLSYNLHTVVEMIGCAWKIKPQRASSRQHIHGPTWMILMIDLQSRYAILHPSQNLVGSHEVGQAY